MVLIGHSMGGLVSHLQTVQSGDDYWRLVSNEPFWQIKADAEGEAKAAGDVLLPAEPVDPPRGHDRHAAPRQHVLEPDDAMAAGQADRLPIRRSPTASRSCTSTTPGLFPARSLLKIDTSIDSLSPSSPIFPVMLAAPAAALGEVSQHRRRGAEGVVAGQSCRPKATAWCRAKAPTSTARRARSPCPPTTRRSTRIRRRCSKCGGFCWSIWPSWKAARPTASPAARSPRGQQRQDPRSASRRLTPMRARRVVVNDLMQTDYVYFRTEPVGENFDPEFTPELTPAEMLALGVFGGKYMTDCTGEFPKAWFAGAKTLPRAARSRS